MVVVVERERRSMGRRKRRGDVIGEKGISNKDLTTMHGPIREYSK